MLNPHRRTGVSIAPGLLRAACVVLLVIGVFGCSRANVKPTTVSVVATTGMIADAANVIGGDRVRVRALMGPGVDPHLYKASPGDVRAMTECDLVLYNGLHLEGRMGDVLEKLSTTKRVVAAAEAIDRARLRSPAEFEGHPDPHVWFDAALWSGAVTRVRDALIEVDPAGKAEFEKRATDYLAELATLDQEARIAIATIPAPARVLVTAHDAFGYFGDAYGLEVHGIQGISTDSEASLASINGLVDLLVARRIPAVFVESSVPEKTIRALVEGCESRGHTLAVGGELFSDAMGATGSPEGTYLGMVRHNIRTIVNALGGKMPESGAHGG